MCSNECVHMCAHVCTHTFPGDSHVKPWKIQTRIKEDENQPVTNNRDIPEKAFRTLPHRGTLHRHQSLKAFGTNHSRFFTEVVPVYTVPVPLASFNAVIMLILLQKICQCGK